MATNIVLNVPKTATNVIINHVQRRFMPVNVPPTATGKRRFRLPVETDPHKLVNYCCGLNYHIDEPMIKLKPDNEYPDWLWTLRLGPKPHSWEMEKGTKEYYIALAEEGKQRNYILKMSSRKPKMVVDKGLKDRYEYIHHLRFAALAHMEDDVGLELDTMQTDLLAQREIKVKSRDYYLPKGNGVLYSDKIEGNIALKNFYVDPDSTFYMTPRSMKKREPIERKPIQDSKRRHRYAGN